MADTEKTGPVEAVAVTGRPQDEPLPNTTFAERAASRRPKAKAVQSDDAENKSMSPRKAARKSR
jgi:hypothetical protein